MEPSIENLADSVRDLNIANGTHQIRGQEPVRPTINHQVSPKDTINTIKRASKAQALQAQSITLLVDDENSSAD